MLIHEYVQCSILTLVQASVYMAYHIYQAQAMLKAQTRIFSSSKPLHSHLHLLHWF